MAENAVVAATQIVPQQAYGMINPEQIGNMMMTNIIISKMSELVSGKVSLSFNNICKLFVFMVFMQSKDKVVGSLKDLIHNIFTFDKNKNMMYKFIGRYLRRKNDKSKTDIFDIELKDGKDDIDKKTCCIEVSYNNINHNLYYYLNSNPDTVTFKKSIKHFCPEDSKTYLLIITFNNIILTIDNYVYKLLKRIEYNITYKIGDNINGNYDDSAVCPPKTYLEILPIKVRNLYDKILFLAKNLHTMDLSKDNVYNAYAKAELNHDTNLLTPFKLCKMISHKNNFDLKETCYTITLLLAFIAKAGAIDKSYSFVKNNTNKTYLFLDPYNDYNLSNYTKEKCGLLEVPAHDSFVEKISEWGYTGYFEEFVNGIRKQYNHNKNMMTISTTDGSDINEHYALSLFFETINKYQDSKHEKVSIHYLELKDVVTKKSVPNPKYLQWKKKKEILDNINNKDNAMAEFMKLDVPEETIDVEEVKREISFKKLNTVQKGINTLYLKKSDMNRLMSNMIQFRDRKDILQKHGLRNKLNVLLYGQPGTGKSTTIEAIATFLGKDIYYVDLKNAKTNHDLQLIFEYVNTHVSNGGIVVMEDIDTMTPIVLQRDENEKEKGLSASINTDLSLDYFLNILQGTLTMDDSIFIVTTNYFDKLDKAFTRDGRFDVKIELEASDHFQISEIYKDFIGRPLKPEILSKIPERKFTPATIIYHLKEFLFNREQPDDIIMERFLV